MTGGVEGVYVETGSSPHVAARRGRLDEGRVHPMPGVPVPVPADPEAARAVLLRQLDDPGLALLALARPLSTEGYLALTAPLGEPQVESSPDVQHRVERRVVLDLVTELPETDDPARQPFASGSLSLHTETSGAPAELRPRYLTLMCVAPGPAPASSQTVVLAVSDIVAALDDDTRRILSHVSYAGETPLPPVLDETQPGGPRLAFRDFRGSPLRWTCDLDVGEHQVTSALESLLLAMYTAPLSGITWERGLLVGIDNTRYLHGRTRWADPGAAEPRHLRRIRIRERLAVPA